MPMRRTIGISLACLMTSACAIAQTPEETTPQDPSETAAARQETAEVAGDRSRGSAPGADACDGSQDRNCRLIPVAASCQFGKAAWYDLVGRRTASGEILDGITATAAHRSLPLASFARVTNLDNGRSVIVKINDRGPFTRGRILDLSPRAADALDMKHAGVAAVALEPLINPAAPTVAVLQTSNTSVTQ